MALAPRLLVVSGAPASGKSTLALALAKQLHWPILDGDDLADTLVTATLKAVCGDPYNLSYPLYSSVISPAKYLVMIAQSRRMLGSGLPLVVASADGERFLSLLNSTGLEIPLAHLHVHLPYDLRVERMRHRAKSGFDAAMIAMGPLERWETSPTTADLIDGNLQLKTLVSNTITRYGLSPRPTGSSPKVLIISGPPASGKSFLAAELARTRSWALLDGEDITSTFCSAILDAVLGDRAAIGSDLYRLALSPAKSEAIAAATLRLTAAGESVVLPALAGIRLKTELSVRGIKAYSLFLDTPTTARDQWLNSRGKELDATYAAGPPDPNWNAPPPGAFRLTGARDPADMTHELTSWLDSNP